MGDFQQIGFDGIGRAIQGEITLKKHESGRWMWAYSFLEMWHGEAFAPLEKWGKFGATKEAALQAAINEMRERVKSDRLRCWLDKIERDNLKQPDLFEAFA